MSIRLRLAISHAILAVSVFVLVGSIIYIFFEQAVRNDVDERLVRRSQEVSRVYIEAGAVARDPLPAGDTGWTRIFSVTGELLAETPVTGDFNVLDQAGFDQALAGERTYHTVPSASAKRRVYYSPVILSDGVQVVIEVSSTMEPTERALALARRFFLIAGTISLPAGLFAGWWMARQALIPVNELTAAVGRLASTGEYGRRVPEPQYDDEIGRLARTFNDILNRLTVLLDRQQALVADTSHELRNPLMVVRGNLDLLVHDLPADQRLEAVTEARDEVDRMARLVGDLLFLADADTESSIERVPIDLDEVVAEIVDDARMVGPDRNIVLDANDPVVVMGDAERLRQLIWNLVENAIRYTPPGGTVHLALHRRARVAEISVTDTGIGIPEEHLPHIFDRFYRVDRGRSRAVGGTGLGLSIVRQVADLHGGHVRVRSIPGEGSTFTVFLPATTATTARPRPGSWPIGTPSRADPTAPRKRS